MNLMKIPQAATLENRAAKVNLIVEYGSYKENYSKVRIIFRNSMKRAIMSYRFYKHNKP
jgi:hypothetical protein